MLIIVIITDKIIPDITLINIEEFSNELISKFNFNYQQKIALAVSGGADSMCMTLLMHKAGFSISCLIVDHGLRAESRAEAEKIQNILNSYNINATTLKWLEYNPTLQLSNLHHKAREARYRLLLDYCKIHNIKYLALAHNKNDQAENVLLRIGRGTGIDGLALIKSSQEIRECQIIRPLLNYTRPKIEETLKRFNWIWVKDQSNHNNRFARTRVRSLLQNNDCSLTVDRLYLLARNAARASDYLEKTTMETLHCITIYHPFGYVSLDVEKFLTCHEEIQLRTLTHILRNIGGKHSVRLTSLERLLDKIRNFQNWHNTTLHDCEILKAKQENRLLFIKEKNTIQKKLIPSGCKETIWDNRFIITRENFVNEEVSIEALSQKHLVALKDKIDSVINLDHHKIKWTLPVILHDSVVLACPLLGWAGNKIKFYINLYNKKVFP